MKNNTVTYSPNKTGKLEWRTTSADRLFLVKKAPVKALTKAQKEASFVPSPDHKNMTTKYDMKGNDIFLTPLLTFAYLSAMLGYDVEILFDPCPAEFSHGPDWAKIYNTVREIEEDTGKKPSKLCKYLL